MKNICFSLNLCQFKCDKAATSPKDLFIYFFKLIFTGGANNFGGHWKWDVCERNSNCVRLPAHSKNVIHG